MANKTALYDRHVALGARMVDFAGWLLPVQYPTGPKVEHRRVREAAGLFDIDHMGQIVVSGPDALPFLQHVMTADVARFGLGDANYSLMCYADGTVVDDVFIYRLPDRYFVAVNASNNEKDTRWLAHHVGDWDVAVQNVSEETYMLALQGPRAEAILQPLAEADLASLPRHHAVETRVAGASGLVGRTGYTGEDGFELYLDATQAARVWDALLAAGAPEGLVPAGLAARDTLRLEAALPLYGQEISAESPLRGPPGMGGGPGQGPVPRPRGAPEGAARGPGAPARRPADDRGGVARHGYPILSREASRSASSPVARTRPRWTRSSPRVGASRARQGGHGDRRRYPRPGQAGRGRAPSLLPGRLRPRGATGTQSDREGLATRKTRCVGGPSVVS